MLVTALTFGMMVVGCGGGGTEDDTWTKVTSLSQLNGTWKTSSTETETESGITTRTVYESILTINASAQTMSGSVKITMTFSGSAINSYWPDIKANFASQASQDDFTISTNDSNHTITMTSPPFPDTPISLSSVADWLINQDGTKIIQPGEEEGEAVTFIKQ